MKRTSAQNKLLYGLLTKLRIDEDAKKALVMQYSNNRTEHSRELTYEEAYELINALQHETPSANKATDRTNRMRRTVISRIYELPERLGFWTADGDKKRFASKTFDNYLKEHPKSPFKGKILNELTVKELAKLVGILEGWKTFYAKKRIGNQESVINN